MIRLWRGASTACDCGHHGWYVGRVTAECGRCKEVLLKSPDVLRQDMERRYASRQETAS